MQNILVPTDFSVQSLNIVHQIVRKHQTNRVRIYLIHMVQIPNDIMDLMFLKKSRLFQQVPDKFNEAVQLLRNKYQSQIACLQLEFYYGNYADVLNRIIESRKIDEVCLPENYNYSLPLPQSVDMIPFFTRCKVPVNRLQPAGRVLVQGEADLLSSLFIEDRQAASTQMSQPTY